MKYVGHTIVEEDPLLVAIQDYQPFGRASFHSHALKRLLFLSFLDDTVPGTAEYTPPDDIQKNYRDNI